MAEDRSEHNSTTRKEGECENGCSRNNRRAKQSQSNPIGNLDEGKQETEDMDRKPIKVH